MNNKQHDKNEIHDGQNSIYLVKPINHDDKTTPTTIKPKTFKNLLLLNSYAVFSEFRNLYIDFGHIYFMDDHTRQNRKEENGNAYLLTSKEETKPLNIYYVFTQYRRNGKTHATDGTHRRKTTDGRTEKHAVYIRRQGEQMKGKNTTGTAQAEYIGQDTQAQGQDDHAERIAEQTAIYTAKLIKAGKQDEQRTYRTLNEKVVFNVKLYEDTKDGIRYGINKAEIMTEKAKEELKQVSLIDADAVTTKAEQEQNAFIKVKMLHGTANALKKTAKAYIQKANI